MARRSRRAPLVIPDGVAEVPVALRLADGTEIGGGTARVLVLGGEVVVDDFRDAAGAAWLLPPGAEFLVEVTDALFPQPPG